MAGGRPRSSAALAIGLTLATACVQIAGTDELAVRDDAADASRETAALPDTHRPPVVGEPDVPAPVEHRDGGADAPFEDPVDAPDADAAPPVVCTPGAVGPRYGAKTSGGGMWGAAGGIRAPDDGIYAHTNGDNGTVLTVLEYGFALPGNARVLGIKVDLARTATGPVRDGAISLPRGGSKANGTWPQGNNDGPYIKTTYGGATDLWGTTWTPAQINDPNFGVSVRADGSGDGHADSLGVTVHYETCQ